MLLTSAHRLNYGLRFILKDNRFTGFQCFFMNIFLNELKIPETVKTVRII